MAVTKEFLNSTRALTYPNYEIILIDNGADLDGKSEIINDFPEVVYLRSIENLGFAGANNLGMSAAKGNYYFIVNNDTEVTPDILQNLLFCFEEYPDTGAVSPKILFFDKPTIIQYMGFKEVSKLTGRSKMLGEGELDVGQFGSISETAYCHGAAMLVKREVVDHVGNFHEGYFMYYEEIDWCLRMRKYGYHLYCQPAAEIYHKDSVTTGKNSAIKTYYYYRNRILFMRRSYKQYQVIIFCIYFILVVIPSSSLHFVLNKQWDHLRSLSRGVWWNLRNLRLR